MEIAPEKITDAFRAYCHQHGIKVIAACQEDDTSQFQLVIDKQADMVNLDRPEVFLPLLRKARSTFTLRTDLLAIPSDGKTLCTQQFQQAIDQINEKGGGRLVLARGAYLTGGLMLRSGVELFLEEGATLLGSTNPDDYQPISISHTDDTRNDNASMALLMAVWSSVLPSPFAPKSFTWYIPGMACVANTDITVRKMHKNLCLIAETFSV